MKKMEFEIFDKWWEYFLVIIWGFSHPTNKKLMGRDSASKIKIKNEYEAKIVEVFNTKDEDKIKNLIDFIDNRYSEEDERKKTIEGKAHSLLGQTSIAVSLLFAAISISTSQYDFLPFYFKLILWLVFFIIILNFVTAGLHARNVVTALQGFAHHSIDNFLIKEDNKIDILIEKYFMCEYNSYLNDVKATYLRFSHWYFKFSFIITVIIALLLPPSLMLANSNKDTKPQNKLEHIYINNGNYQTLKIDTTKTEIDTLK